MKITFPWHFWSSVINMIFKPFLYELHSSCSWLINCQVWRCKKQQCFAVWHSEAVYWSVPAMFQLLQAMNEFSDWRGQVSSKNIALSYCLFTTDCCKPHILIIPGTWTWTGRASYLSYLRIIWTSAKCLWTLTSKSKDFTRKQTPSFQQRSQQAGYFFS